jgi:Right handed beta helix region
MLLSRPRLRHVSLPFSALALALLMTCALLGGMVSSAAARSTSSTAHHRKAKASRSRHARRRVSPPSRRRHKQPTAPKAPATPPAESPTSVPAKESSAPVSTTPISTSPEVPVLGKTSAPTTAVTCDLVASPSGSDSTGDGTLANPYQTVVKLDEALAPGQTGCLRGGSYGSISTLHRLANNGTPSGGQITITAYPGESPTVVGWVDIEGSYTTISDLKIDGSNNFYQMAPGSSCPSPVSQSLDLAGAGDVFEHNDYYQSVASLRGNGLGVGFWGDSDNTVIRYNRIHDVGSCTQHDHIIYLASGNNVQIYDNWLYNDHNGFGVSVYPHPTNARISANVMYNVGVGVAFGDNGTSTVSGNKAWNNVVADSFGVPGDGGETLQAVLVLCADLDSSSTGNEIFANDSYENPQGISAINSHLSSAQISLRETITVDPQFVDAAAGDFAVEPGSPVASWGLWNGDESQPTASSATKHRALAAAIAKRVHTASIARRHARATAARRHAARTASVKRHAASKHSGH